MKAGNVTRFLLNAGIAAMAFACFFQSAGAIEPRRNVSKEIEELRGSIDSIDLYAITTSLSFRVGLTEQDVVRIGCSYSVTEKDEVSALIRVLVDAQLAQPPDRISTAEPRIVAYLHMSDGGVHALVLSQEFSNGPTRGTYDKDVIVTAKDGFANDLRQWRKVHKSTRLNDPTCNNA